jgi:mono/diheme cytochrome c family protein
MIKPKNAIRVLSQAALAATFAVLPAAFWATGCSSEGGSHGGQTVVTGTGGTSNTPGSTNPPSEGTGGTASNTPTGMPGAMPASTAPATTAEPASTAPTSGTQTTPTGTTTGTAAAAACPTDSTLSVNGAAPAAFITECSSCHGATANGRAYYPPLRTGYTFAQVQTAVRGGVVSTKTTITTAQGKMIQAQMPAFLPTRVSDAELMAIFNYISQPPTAPDPNAAPAPYCLSRPEATWTADQIQTALTNGITAWRTPGTVDGNACSFCHGPDPMDLAFIGYTDSQMYRRAFSHIGQPTIDAIIDMVHALRAKYQITAPPNPLTYRPFQPGGDVLPGSSSMERDQAFGQELSDMGLTLMGAPINSVATAQKAWQELSAINLRQLKVGIPLNKYTEDIFNNDGVVPPCPDLHECDDHGTIADWITDAPVLTAATAPAFYAVQDAYLANPTLENIVAVLRAGPRDNTSWFKNKYLSVQIANYLFRQQAGGMPLLDSLPATPGYTVPFPVDQMGYLLNSIWMVGANQRDFIHNDGATLTVGGGKFNVPADTIPGLAVNNANAQLTRIIVPWFWLGFSLDPSTLNVEADYVAEGDEYFTQETFLDNGSYPIHGAFIVSKRTVSVMGYGTNPLPRSPNVFPFSHPDLGKFPVTPLVMRSGYFPELTNFAEQKNFNVINNYQIMYMPSDNATHKALFETYTANMYRMFLWQLVGELQATPSIWNPTIMKGKIAKAQIFLSLPDVVAANGAQDTALIAQVNQLIASAKVNGGN